MEKMAINTDTISESSKGMASAQSVSKQLPPHLRHKKKPEQSSEDSTTGPEGSTTGSLSTATTLRKEKEEIAASKRINYNAWDSKGLRYKATKDPTVASSSASVASGETEQDSNVIGDWDDIPPAPVPQTRGGSKWPKASEVSILDPASGSLTNS